MHFVKFCAAISLISSTIALPITGTSIAKRDLQFRKYADFQISSGEAGNALSEAQAKFPIDTNNLKGVSSSDLAIINAARETAEAAETDAFNGQIKAASGAAATALQNGKIKNKVLKLFLEVSALQIQQAQGADNQDKIDEETKKLNNNISLDKKAAGQTSKAVTFTGDVQPKN
ncbi:uncharacterized protein TrAFT101_009390 [Trichoderma asperellum]|uniref:Small secreted protein n=1 Tax=Trichoderma asperellum (strain ATCC 204424 / CBS 433.97 / NBRC 101777) TaxID=1042311 RepID=A0A2T3YSS6_TRIA4|nr:hypothetical protein M441DRAFT_31787 [Trichoderma asperellum CBS 433.97]PTB35569.1 hypothetical protein M441DRAFT_31787 [Trichoderma asperellum CBS 433.97]UKZ94519.1 hypothetical protein TrAFT101_009390 [Trichoderma asperellum]